MDFSETIFICTGNYSLNILEPLLDRIEVIEIDDYTFNEKIQIAEKYLIPISLKEYGFKPNQLEDASKGNQNQKNQDKESKEAHQGQQLTFNREIIETIIKEYSNVSYGVRWIKKLIDKIVRKANFHLYTNNIKENLVITQDNLTTFLGKGKNTDINFKNMIKSSAEPGSLLVVDLKGYLVKMFFQERGYTSSNNNSTDKIGKQLGNSDHSNIFKDITVTGKLDGPVKEALKISVQLARNKLNSILSEEEIAILKSKDFHLHLTYPYEAKKGNSYGLSFYIALCGTALNWKIPQSDYLMLGEVTPFGKVLTVKGLKNIVNICEFYELNYLVLPEGN